MSDTGTTGGKAPRGQRGGGRKPVDSKTRALIRKLARDGKSRNAVAREAGVSTSTVTKVCSEARPPITFDRSATKVAVEARVVDLKARRVELAQLMLETAFTLHGKLFEQRTVSTTDGSGGVVSYEVDPTAKDWQATLTAIGIATDKHLLLVRTDSDDRDLPAVDAWLQLTLGRTA